MSPTKHETEAMQQNLGAQTIQPQPIEIRNLKLQVQEKTLIEQGELRFLPGKINLLLGPSGAGKSLLLRIMAGLLDQSSAVAWSGEIRIGDRAARAGAAGVVFQSFALFDEFSAEKNIRFALDHRRQVWNHLTASQWLELFGIPGKTRTTLLSGGQRQRLAIARTMASDRPVVLFDEPTSGLDHANAQRVAAWIRQSQQQFGQTSVIVTHDFENLLGIADHVFFFDVAEKQIIELPREQWSTIAERLERSPILQKEPIEIGHLESLSGAVIGNVGTRTSIGSAFQTATANFLDATTWFFIEILRSLLYLIPMWKSGMWGWRFLRQSLGLVIGPANWFYMGIAGIIIGWIATHFTFRFLPFRNYTEPLIIENLLSAIGFATYRILVPIIGTILVAAHCGAAVTAELGGKKLSGQLDAMRSFGVSPRRYLQHSVVWSFLIGMPVLVFFAFFVAQIASQISFNFTHPEHGYSMWRQYYFNRLELPDNWFYFGTWWTLAKLLCCGWVVGFYSYYFGTQEKLSQRDVSQAVTRTILWSTIAILVVHLIFAFWEFPLPR
jgi:ABC-type multidrug transport system ATPase subunit/ABC-type transporter Mla maintaining outer membrane lipid asymmetry permease subunit MlaE